MESSNQGSRDESGQTQTQAHTSTVSAGHRIGAYRLLQPLGEGGMGEVWLAEQVEPVRRRVAVKVVKAGLDTAAVVARFQAERQTLALMDHPAIARVFDAGSTDQGRPYFAMEYVAGESLNTYADRHKLSIAERLELFMQVCEGVQHAHQKGVIHRDLKPSNILVAVQGEKPAPKIIDFGISKATTQELSDSTLRTVFGGFLGTPEYMSPEQAESGSVDVDTRSDVYALGVVLYELLTGLLPFDREAFRGGGLDAIRRTLRDTEPPRPSTRVMQARSMAQEPAADRRSDPPRLAAALRGDLDWIVLKALEKDRTKRYQTANALALDLRRHLADEPVAAGPPSATYRLGKFVRRHRFGVAAAALLILLLVGFSVVSVMQAARVARERDRANREAQTAQRVISFLVGLFNISDPSEARGNAVTAREVLDRGATTIDSTLAAQPEVQARLQATIGRVYMNLGFYREAQDLLQKSVARYRATLGEDDAGTMDALSALADVYFFTGQLSQAESLYGDLVARRERLLGPDHADTLKTRFDLAGTYIVTGRLADGEALTRRTLDAQRRVLGSEHIDTLASLNNLGVALHRLKRHGEERTVMKELLDVRLRALGPDHPDTLRSHHNVGMSHADVQDWPEAERSLTAAIAGRSRVIGNEHPAVLLSRVSLADVYQRQRKFAAAERELLGVAKIRRVDESSDTPVQWFEAEGVRINLAATLARLYEAWGKSDKASAWAARAPKAD